MNYVKQEFSFKTHYTYYKIQEKEQLFAKIKENYIKVNPIYDKNTPFFPIRVAKDKIEYVSKYTIFSSVKTIKKGVIELTQLMTIEERLEARKKNRNEYQREYQREYLRKKRTRQIEIDSVTTPLPNPKQIPVHPLTWFNERIGFIVYRDKPTCKCDDCVRLLEQGWLIMDENDCLRLYNEQIKYGVRFEDGLENQTLTQ